jgi:hypothetical protein
MRGLAVPHVASLMRATKLPDRERQIVLRANANLSSKIKLIWGVQPAWKKYSRFFERQITG